MWFILGKRANSNNCFADVFNLQVGWLQKYVSKCSVLLTMKHKLQDSHLQVKQADAAALISQVRKWIFLFLVWQLAVFYVCICVCLCVYIYIYIYLWYFSVKYIWLWISSMIITNTSHFFFPHGVNSFNIRYYLPCMFS